jgi:hypothetical protein
MSMFNRRSLKLWRIDALPRPLLDSLPFVKLRIPAAWYFTILFCSCWSFRLVGERPSRTTKRRKVPL